MTGKLLGGRYRLVARLAVEAERGLVPRLAYGGSAAAVGTVSAVEPAGRGDR